MRLPRSHRPLAALLTAAMAAAGLYFATRTGMRAQLGAALETAAEIAPISLQHYGQSFNHGYPHLIRARGGDYWCVYVSARPRELLSSYNVSRYEEGDFIIVRRKSGEQWSGEIAVSEHFGINFEPVLAEDARGGIFAVWTSRREGRFSLYSRRIGRDGSLGSVTRVLPAGRFEGRPSLVADSSGKLWLAAESFRRGGMDIVFYSLEGSGWKQQPGVATSANQEFRPRLRAAAGGSIWAAWDAYEDGKYRVKLRRFDPGAGRWGREETFPGDGPLDGYAPDLDIDSAGRVWLAYARNEVETPIYGRRGFERGPAPRPTVRLVVREPDGAWSYPMPAPGGEAGRVSEGDLPRIRIGSDDSVWVAWQQLPGHVDWKLGMAVYKGGQWSAPRSFGEDEPAPIIGNARRADQLPSFWFDSPTRAVIAYQRGRGTFQNRDIFERQVQLSGMPPGRSEPRLERYSQEQLRPVRRDPRRPLGRQPVFGDEVQRYQLYFGDLHNHLLVDDGHQGSVDQLFAIHRDRFGTDFGATTSHGDSNKLLYSELARNDALTEALLEEGRFVTIPGFEWTQGDYVTPRAGHRHVIYETPGGPLYRPTEGFSDSIREFVDLMRQTNGLIFAHHITRPLTSGTDWSYIDVQVEPAAEIASSWGRFEYYRNPGHIRGEEVKGCSMQDVWRMGWRLGVIGGSDGHNLYGDRIQGLTGVYARELTRAAIFEAIRRRRCYGTTGEPIELEFRVNGHMMGSEVESESGPLIEGAVRGTAKLLAVEIVKYEEGWEGNFPTVHRAALDGNTARVWWRDPNFGRDALYYLRVTQEVDPRVAARYAAVEPNPFPTEMAWSSPVWVSKSR